MNIKWPPEKTFEYDANTKALKEEREAGISIIAEKTPRKVKEVSKEADVR